MSRPDIASAGEPVIDRRYPEVAGLLQDYLDGLYTSDAAKLGRVFHPDAHYVCASETPLVLKTMAEYLPMVAHRPSPASRGERRLDDIQAIELAGPATAFAKVRCAIGERLFTDFLTLIRVDGRWQVIAKVFHVEPRPPQPA